MKGLTLYPNYSYYPLSPYYGETLSDGGVVTFYRWIASSDDIPELTCGTDHFKSTSRVPMAPCFKCIS